MKLRLEQHYEGWEVYDIERGKLLARWHINDEDLGTKGILDLMEALDIPIEFEEIV